MSAKRLWPKQKLCQAHLRHGLMTTDALTLFPKKFPGGQIDPAHDTEVGNCGADRDKVGSNCKRKRSLCSSILSLSASKGAVEVNRCCCIATRQYGVAAQS